MRRTESEAGVVSAQSLSPLAAVGTEASTPIATSRRDAVRASLPPNRSSSSDEVHVPIGKSVRNGCSACPSGVPASVSFTGPFGTTPRTHLATASAGPSRAATAPTRSASWWRRGRDARALLMVRGLPGGARANVGRVRRTNLLPLALIAVALLAGSLAAGILVAGLQKPKQAAAAPGLDADALPAGLGGSPAPA